MLLIFWCNVYIEVNWFLVSAKLLCFRCRWLLKPEECSSPDNFPNNKNNNSNNRDKKKIYNNRDNEKDKNKIAITMGRRFSLKIVDDTLKKIFFKVSTQIQLLTLHNCCYNNHFISFNKAFNIALNMDTPTEPFMQFMLTFFVKWEKLWRCLESGQISISQDQHIKLSKSSHF